MSTNKFIDAMLMMYDAYDPYTVGHGNRVGALSHDIALRMGMDQKVADNLRLMGMVHDVGKIAVPIAILAKPTKLTPIEYELIKTHVNVGYEIFRNFDDPKDIATVILQHHERLDGSGYPHGLKEDEILLESKILAIADTIEAMSSNRPYRNGLGMDVTLREIDKGRGTKYDRKIANTVLKMFRKENYTIKD